MTDTKSLTLDLDTGARPGDKLAARIAVADAWGFTRHGGGAIVTRDCTSLAALEREVERLKQELDEALAEGRARLAGKAPAPKADAPARVPEARQILALDTNLRVADVMTREVRTLGPNDQVSLADELMKQGHFRHVVIVDDGRVVGVLSQRDIFHGALAWSLGYGRKAHERLLAASSVKNVMASHAVTVDQDAPLAEAAALLREHKIGCLPVVAGDALVGILTEGDFLALLARRA
jgi:CBS domain-containing protein